MVPVEDCIATTGAMTGKGCGGVGGGGIGDGVWGAMKEGEGCKVAVDGEDFSGEVGGLMRPGRKTRWKKSWLALSLSQSRRMSIDLDFFGLTEEVARPMAHSLSTNRRGGDCWGWPRLVRVSVSSTNTCSPPIAEAYSASATDATTTGMHWQWAWRGALWMTEDGKVKDGLD